MAKKQSQANSGGSGMNSTPRGMQRAMVNLYHNMYSLLPEQQSRVILFISCQTGKDGSVLVREFAKAVALSLEKRVLLVDADRHKPSQAAYFKVDNSISWEQVIDGEAEIGKAVAKTSSGRLFVSSAFGNTGSHQPVFDSPAVPDLMDSLRSNFDLILIDAPSLTESTDGLTLTRLVDGVIIVIDAEATRFGAAMHVTRRIVDTGGRVLGTILNKRRFPIPRFIYRWV